MHRVLATTVMGTVYYFRKITVLTTPLSHIQFILLRDPNKMCIIYTGHPFFRSSFHSMDLPGTWLSFV
jgi:hypothetical protein